jgi:hypothetical protein
MPSKPIPPSVVEKDHTLERSHDKASEALAKHRWHWTTDESNPDRVSVRAYARAIGRHYRTIQSHASGYAEWLRVTGSEPVTLGGMTLTDCIRLSFLSAETQQIAVAVAEGEGSTPAEVAQGRNRQRLRVIEVQARERAERHGTDPVDEARGIAQRSRQTREMEVRHREKAVQRTSVRFTIAEGKLASAKRYVLDAMREVEGVDMTDEEMELMRSTVANITALLNLLDLRLAGQPDIDWDGELERLTRSAG